MLGVDRLLQCAGVVGGGVGRHLLLLSLYERLTGLVVNDLCAVVAAARLLAMKLAVGRVDLRSMREAIVSRGNTRVVKKNGVVKIRVSGRRKEQVGLVNKVPMNWAFGV